MSTEPTELTVYEPRQMGMITPLVSPNEAKAAIARYEALKQAIVRDDDKQKIGPRIFLKKSFWRRVANCFGVSLELAREEHLIEDDGRVYGYSVIYRAVAPSGQSVEGDGLCMSNEKAGMTRHTVRATAHTRAKNRAISDLVGGGEVSAEEVHYDDDPNIVDERPIARGGARPTPIAKGSTLNWGALRLKATQRGIRTQADWEAFARRHLSIADDADFDTRAFTADHYAILDRALDGDASLEGLPVGGKN